MGIVVVDTMEMQRATGPASILAVGTATHENYVHQAECPDYYFHLTSSEHVTELEEKFARVCRNTEQPLENHQMRANFSVFLQRRANFVIDQHTHAREVDDKETGKRHFVLTERLLKENPVYMFLWWSVSQRQARHMQKLGDEAASKAKITHIVVCTTVAAEMPGADIKLIRLLGLDPTVKRVLLYHQGSFIYIARLIALISIISST